MNIEKLVQATGYLLKKYENRRLNYTKLIKELYLADRATIAESNQAITGDTYVSMKHGPVLSCLYDLIRGKGSRDAQDFWNSRFSTDGTDLLANFDQFPEGKLSKAEKEILDKIDGQFHQKQYGELIDYTHASCPEWKDPRTSSDPISLKDILSALGRTQEEIEWVLAENRAFAEEDKMFSTLADE
jgi:uncharacterized phage-associated protein